MTGCNWRIVRTCDGLIGEIRDEDRHRLDRHGPRAIVVIAAKGRLYPTMGEDVVAVLETVDGSAPRGGTSVYWAHRRPSGGSDMGEIRCGDCDAVLARTSATGVPLRPIWPGYETIEARRDGSRYVLVKCVHCEGAPPLTWRQSAVLLAVYALALGFSGYLAVILKDLATWQGPHAPWDLIAAGMVAAVMAAWGLWAARQQRWKWIRAAADQPH